MAVDKGEVGFEISATDLKQELESKMALAGAGANAFILRSQPVMLAADVALIFDVETRAVVQNIKSNPEMFPERYAFELTASEVDELRSVGLISKLGRGGSRALPYVVTRKGSIRLATIMKSEKAIKAADVFIDVFDEVAQQLSAGADQIAIANPSRVISTRQDRTIIAAAREQVANAVKGLFDTVVDVKNNTTVADELHAVSAEAVNHLKAWLSGKSIANDKIAAETLLVIEQARDMYERRQADLADKALDRDRKALENLRIKISLAEELHTFYQKLEPTALVDLTNSFATLGFGQKASMHLVPPNKDEKS